jgi:hypothetical protein
MENKVKQLSIYIAIVLLLLVLIECFAFWRNGKNGDTKPFFLDVFSMRTFSYETLEGYGFDVIDPLLGWGSSEMSIKGRGYKEEYGMAVLETNCMCEDTLRVLITGGSTTDIVLHPENWPNRLVELFEREHQCVKLVVAATGGYNSGQELLKLIRDGLKVNPGIHISYSGVNDCIYPDYVSKYEGSLFKKLKGVNKATVFLPNTYHYLSQSQILPTKMYLHELPKQDPVYFWFSNMQSMAGIANQNKYSFVGILQPANGIGKLMDEAVQKRNQDYISTYQRHYPRLKEIVHKNSDYLIDFTSIFDTCKGNVYLDDCHVEESYQGIIANHMFQVIQSQRPNLN